MLPFKQIGPTVTVAAAATGAVAYPSDMVLVSNSSATVWGFFSPMATGETQPASGVGVPVGPNEQVLVAVPENTASYGVQGAQLYITPVQVTRPI